MSSDNIAQLLYLGTLVAVLGGGFLLSKRLKLGQTLQMAAVWVLIFIGAVAAVGVWSDIQDDLFAHQTRFDDQGTITIPRSLDGHYNLTLDVNGVPTEFVVDTGATQIVLSQKDADKLGLNPDELTYFGRALTANGEVRTAPVRLDTVAIGPYNDLNLPAVVNAGDLGQSLLGMNYLQRWSRIEISDGKLTLSR